MEPNEQRSTQTIQQGYDTKKKRLNIWQEQVEIQR